MQGLNKGGARYGQKKKENYTSDLALYISSLLSQLALPLPELLLWGWFGLKDTQHLLHPPSIPLST
jgi:hypothetical protein